MRRFVVVLVALAGTVVAGESWQVSGTDSFGWRRALITVGDDRLAIVCPPNAAPFAVPVTARRDDMPAGRVTLGLEVDGERYEQSMSCSELLCEADLPRATWRALTHGETVTVWIDDWRGPTFPLAGSAAALAACSPNY